jgi:hypothetical protein
VAENSEAPVEPVDTTVATTSEAPTVVVETPAPPKKRRRFGWIIALVVVVVVLVVGFFVADAIAKQVATDMVRDQIRSVLKLDPQTPVDVDLGPGSVLLQAARGSIDRVDVAIDELTFGDVTGAATLTATSVPLDSSRPVQGLGIEVTVSEQNVRKLASFISASELKSIDLQDGLVRVGAEFNLIFFVLPVQVDLATSAVDGGIAFDPTTILLGGEEISVQDLRDSPEFAALAGELLDSQVFCVASYLPQALVIDDVDVVGSNMVVSINGDGTALGDPSLSTLGTCPAQG